MTYLLRIQQIPGALLQEIIPNDLAHAAYGDQYDMDRIIGIQCTDGTVKFADQDGYEMDHEMIEVQEKVNG